VYLIGHSLGGWIATSYALKYPNIVQGVVVISPEGFSLRRWKKYNIFTKWLLKHRKILNLWLLGLAAINSLGDESPLLQGILGYWRKLQKFPTTCQLFLCRSVATIKSELVGSKLPWLRTPLLVLQIEPDDPATIADSQAFAQAAPRSQYQCIAVGARDSDDRVVQQIATEIHRFVDRVQSEIDREERSLW
jgi:pimeloyl-ACP methyl ester carboxylesterase